MSSIQILGFDQTNINDYKQFSTGKKYFQTENYEDAMREFEILEKKYPDSLLFKSNYANYYIGMTHYKLGDYDQARNFLERAIYIPKEFKIDDSYLKKHFFEYRRNYYLGKIYLKQGLIEEALKHFKFLIKNYYSQDLETYEKLALKELGEYESYYEILYQVRYENSLSLVSYLRNEDIISTGDFFLSKGLYSSAERVYSYYLSIKEKDTRQVELSLLETFQRQKKYEELVSTSLELIKSETGDVSDFYYYLSMGYMQLGEGKKAEESFAMITGEKYKEASLINRARLFSISGDYLNAISILKENPTENAHRLLIETYLKADMQEEFKKAAVDYIKKQPHSDKAAYYRFLLYKEDKNKNYLNWIIKYNFNSYYYEVAYSITENMRTLEKYPLNYKKRIYKDYINKLNAITKLRDGEILKIEFENLDFPEKDNIFKGYLMSKVYEEGGLYLHAILNSKKHQDVFSKYSNLVPFLYPRYYNLQVRRAAKKYNIEEALIYSVILQESSFDESLISRAEACGLMQIRLSTAMEMNPSITIEDLFVPDTNIDLGARYLKELLKRFDGDVGKTLASYNAGADNVTNWPSDEKGDLDIEKIPFSETKQYVKRTLNNYYKYKRIY
jgi:soluble lytic murein transglycosylase